MHRVLSRLAILSLVASTALVGIPAQPVAAAVTNVANETQLRDAFAAASGNGLADTIILDTNITLSAGDCTGHSHFGLEADGDLDHNDSGLLTIDGQGVYGITQQCVGARVIQNFNGPITLVGVTIAGGDLQQLGTAFGGGLYSGSSGPVTITNSVFENNTATSDGSGAQGGAVMADNTVTVTGSTFTSNSAIGLPGDPGPSGGASGNGTSGSGGFGGALGIFGDVSVTGSTFTSNSAVGGQGGAGGDGSDSANGGSGRVAEGGAIWNDGNLSVMSSGFTTNSATGGDGGAGGISPVLAHGGSGGNASGAALATYGQLTLTSTTMAGNSADGGDGGPGGDVIDDPSSAGNGGKGGNVLGGAAFASAPGVAAKSAHDHTISDVDVSGTTATGGSGGGTTDAAQGAGGGGGHVDGGAIWLWGAVEMTDSSVSVTTSTSGDGGPAIDTGGTAGDVGGGALWLNAGVSSASITALLERVSVDGTTSTGGDGGTSGPGSPGGRGGDITGGAIENAGNFLLFASSVSGTTATTGLTAPSGAGANGSFGSFLDGGAIYTDLKGTTGAAPFNFSMIESVVTGTVASITPAGDGGSDGDGGSAGDLVGGAVETVGTALIDRSSIVLTTATGGDAGQPNGAGSGQSGGIVDGAGLASLDGATLVIENSTIAENTGIGGLGSGVLSDGLVSGAGVSAIDPDIRHSTLANNSGDVANLSASSVTSFASVFGPAIGGQSCDLSSMTSSGGNVDTDESCLLGHPTDIVDQLDTDISLESLGDYGGPTPTMRPTIDSVLVDLVANASCDPAIAEDQRGLERPHGGTGCDSGAVEVDQTGPAVSGVSATPDRVPEVPAKTVTSVSGTLDDSGNGGSTIVSATASLGGLLSAATADDGLFDESVEAVTAVFDTAGLAAGDYNACISGLDSEGNVSAVVCTTVTVVNVCPSSAPNAFTDDNGNIHEGNINCIAFWNITSGKGAGVYDPSGNVTRGQMATFIAQKIKTAGVALPVSPPDAFTDDGGSIHHDNINALAALGVVGGKGGGLYDQNGLVTRGQMATFMANAVKAIRGTALAAGPDAFTDDNGTTHEANINAIAAAGIARGKGGTIYDPFGNVTRDQMATFIANCMRGLFSTGHWPDHGV